MPTPLQKVVIETLMNGGTMRSHINPEEKMVYRLSDKNNNPVMNLTQVRLDKLLKKGRIKKVKGKYVYAKRSEPLTTIVKKKFEITYDNGVTWYEVDGATVGRAKYAFWLEVKKIDPSVEYKQVRGRMSKVGLIKKHKKEKAVCTSPQSPETKCSSDQTNLFQLPKGVKSTG